MSQVQSLVDKMLDASRRYEHIENLSATLPENSREVTAFRIANNRVRKFVAENRLEPETLKWKNALVKFYDEEIAKL